mmetsp:Transcript_37090/g.82499  ORF Transcript_37090/g.82499 Transcript_37090/m.82499 type:complete len:207 (+) Transcript_37090:702-1322(+)|eukprot:CAMPEP_0202896004 /NCGR_PEP_ID=MMETSP1392-20130828/5093_1 /ASSEMBLY_ACC=CAM_ASM_000868 /TAXON_ID=225041 /ORGANISM="Chlamydomonas chlamydogama, Strain SAG 11-48b" /LENGTH=206 /DNA_ID=CAMNT_0049581211 /DNA_START=629 /DNA_END=1249 /DNA_ORIENTATION=-
MPYFSDVMYVMSYIVRSWPWSFLDLCKGWVHPDHRSIANGSLHDSCSQLDNDAELLHIQVHAPCIHVRTALLPRAGHLEHQVTGHLQGKLRPCLYANPAIEELGLELQRVHVDKLSTSPQLEADMVLGLQPLILFIIAKLTPNNETTKARSHKGQRELLLVLDGSVGNICVQFATQELVLAVYFMGKAASVKIDSQRPTQFEGKEL